MNSGVRQIELDVYADSTGGRYAHPAAIDAVAAAGLPKDPDFDPEGIMRKPGFKVMHVQDYDYRSVCQPFVACLKIVRDWSEAHPKHLPLYILLETKQTDLPAQWRTTFEHRLSSVRAFGVDGLFGEPAEGGCGQMQPHCSAAVLLRCSISRSGLSVKDMQQNSK